MTAVRARTELLDQHVRLGGMGSAEQGTRVRLTSSPPRSAANASFEQRNQQPDLLTTRMVLTTSTMRSSRQTLAVPRAATATGNLATGTVLGHRTDAADHDRGRRPALAPQIPLHLSGAVPWRFHKASSVAPHQFEVVGALGGRMVVEASPRDRDQFAAT